MGAGLFQRLSPEPVTVRAELFSIAEIAEISGIAIRNEQPLYAHKALRSAPENGRKYSAGESLAVFKDGDILFSSSSAIFCSYQGQRDGANTRKLHREAQLAPALFPEGNG